MSILTLVETDIEKFIKGTETDVEKFYTAFAKLFGKAPSVLQTVQNFISEAAPIITVAVALALPGGSESVLVAGALALVQTGLAAVQAALSAATTGNSLLTNLQNFANSVPQLLSGLEIKNPALVALIEKIINLVTAEAKVLIPAVQAWVAQLKALPSPAAA
jgi:hypothetical protein